MVEMYTSLWLTEVVIFKMPLMTAKNKDRCENLNFGDCWDVLRELSLAAHCAGGLAWDVKKRQRKSGTIFMYKITGGF